MIKYFLTLFLLLTSFLNADESPVRVRAKVPVIALHDQAPVMSLYQEAIPRWVAVLSVPEGALPTRSPDAQILLIDKQVNVDTQTTYYHLAKRVIEPEAIRQHSLIELPFDPSFQEITLHSLCLRRNGVRLDRVASDDFHLALACEACEKTAQRRWSLMTLLDDVREGDIIEYSYSTKGQNPAHMDRIIDECVFRYPYPVERIYYRVIGLNPCGIFVKEHNTRLQPTRQQLGPDGWEWVWNGISIPGYTQENNQPSWYQEAAWIQISEFEEWADVSRWGYRLFMQQNPPGPKALALVKEWNSQYTTDNARALAALRFVQDNITLVEDYTEELYFPKDSESILEQRVGSSSDKAQLLRSLLRLMNIEATPAAVSRRLRQSVSEWHPSPAPFDHVILQLTLDGITYWIDPASTDQGGDLHASFCSQYQRALLLDGNAHEFICLGMPLGIPEITATTTYYLWPDKLETSILLETVIRGDTANRLRRQLRLNNDEAIEEPYLCSHAAIKVAAPEIRDDRHANTIYIKAHYRAENIWQISQSGRLKLLSVHPIYCALQPPKIRGKRRTPIALQYPFHVVETVNIIAPGHIWTEGPPIIKHFLSQFMDCYVSFTTSEDTLTMESELKMLVDYLLPKNLEGHQALVKQVQEALTLKADMPTTYRRPWDITYPFLINVYLLLAIGFLAVDPTQIKRK